MIHPTAIVDPSAELGHDVSVGAFAMIEARVRVGDGTVLHPRAHLGSGTVLGARNVVHIGAVLGRTGDGRAPADDGVGLVVGDRNEFRENSSVVRGTSDRPTRIGDDNYVMGGARIGAGVVLGAGTTIAAYAVIAQDVQVDDTAFVSGNVVVHQGVRIGRLAFVSGLSAVYRDAPPFMMVGGRPASTLFINREGLKRAGFSQDTRDALKQAYKRLFRVEAPNDAELARIVADLPQPEVAELVDFVRARRDEPPALEDHLIV